MPHAVGQDWKCIAQRSNDPNSSHCMGKRKVNADPKAGDEDLLKYLHSMCFKDNFNITLGVIINEVPAVP